MLISGPAVGSGQIRTDRQKRTGLTKGEMHMKRSAVISSAAAMVFALPLGAAEVPGSVDAVAQPGGDLPGDPQIALVKIADGFNDPINVTNAGDGSGRMFVVERVGRVKVVDSDGNVQEEPFLDLTTINPLGNDVQTGFVEQGLYAVAFHPNFSENGYFYVHYASLPFNGDGKIAFGPDGYLYIGSGDGGWEGDPYEAGQDLTTWLGKILRIDVDVQDDADPPYAIPDDNPFANAADERLMVLFGITEEEFATIKTRAKPEIWAYGLRNPYEFAFDPASGDLFITDVGQNHWEEIIYQPAGSSGGQNYGWPRMEAAYCHPMTGDPTKDSD